MSELRGWRTDTQRKGKYPPYMQEMPEGLSRHTGWQHRAWRTGCPQGRVQASFDPRVDPAGSGPGFRRADVTTVQYSASSVPADDPRFDRGRRPALGVRLLVFLLQAV